MDDQLTIGVVTALIGVAGVIIGFALDFGATYLRDRRTEAAENESLRTLLALEIEHNLSRLRDLRDRGREAAKTTTGGPDGEAYGLISIPWAGWRRTAWDTQGATLPRALRPDQIRRVYQLYDHLDQLESIRNVFADTQSKSQATYREHMWDKDPEGKSKALSAAGDLFVVAMDLWPQFERIADQVLRDGNPLGNELRR